MVIADTKAIQLETIHPDFVTIMLRRQATYSRFLSFFQPFAHRWEWHVAELVVVNIFQDAANTHGTQGESIMAMFFARVTPFQCFLHVTSFNLLSSPDINIAPLRDVFCVIQFNNTNIWRLQHSKLWYFHFGDRHSHCVSALFLTIPWFIHAEKC